MYKYFYCCSNIGRNFQNIYIFIFFAKKAVISKDIKAERKSNPLKTLTGKEEFIMFLSIPNNTKNPKNENTNMNWKNKIT